MKKFNNENDDVIARSETEPALSEAEGKQSSATNDPGSPRSARDDVATLTADLQRIQADFENYRKNVDAQKTLARQNGEESTILKLLPIIDNIDRAVNHIPEELANNEWARGVASLGKNLENLMNEFGLTKINAQPGTKFDPSLHEAVQFDENATGKTEVIETELQPGYLLNGVPIRHSMVRVTKK